ncbi:tRNA (guanine(37)-N1)-methyltransferase-like [Gigantopelta aegis]|uniref:tRNA (guanine(37)-N1)-methyltransferase-like n=1 Tax=Gigantopelta aegis TaxID=1735272 RepID=UPI001B887ADE|nr:tRNA (guanine(37)-N1)-methyltransferase-like [Gigantopelta aegis]
MILRLIFQQPVLGIGLYTLNGVKRFFQNKCHVNVEFGRCPPNQFRIAPLKRLVKCRIDIDGGKAEINLRAFFNLVRFFSRYIQLLPHLVKSVMSGKCETADVCPPEAVRGMTKLDQNAFGKTVLIPALRIPVKSIKDISRHMKSYFLKMPKVKPVAVLSECDPDKASSRLLLLSPAKCSCIGDLPEQVKSMLIKHGVEMEKLAYFTLDLKYENWSIPDVLRAVLPDDAENVSGFSVIGHIAHLNLKPQVEDYKFLIGEVILDKTPGIRTVVNKLNIIDNTFRNFQMELLAGEDNYITQARENGCVFKFDFSKVYWNPRLGTEHQRIVDLVKKNDIVFDIFAGVGPFTIPAAKKGAIVFANDLNPDSFAAMKENVTLNKVKTLPQLYNTDGRDFIKTVLKDQFLDFLRELQQQEMGERLPPKIHIVMNLPGLALEFLDTFRSLCVNFPLDISRDLSLVKHYPTIHCYCFSKSPTPEEEVQERAHGILGTQLPSGHQIRYVRNVAPNKEMMCISFTLTPEIIFEESFEPINEPEVKKSRLN